MAEKADLRQKTYKDFNPFDIEAWQNVGNKVGETLIGQDAQTESGNQFKPGVFALGLDALGKVAKEVPSSALVGIEAGKAKDPYLGAALAQQSSGLGEREMRAKEAEANRNIKIQELLAAQKLKEKELETETNKSAEEKLRKEAEAKAEKDESDKKMIIDSLQASEKSGELQSGTAAQMAGLPVEQLRDLNIKRGWGIKLPLGMYLGTRTKVTPNSTTSNYKKEKVE